MSAPLSFNQEARLLLELWAQKRSARRPPFHVLLGLRLSGTLDVAALERTLAEIVRRHDVFRTSVTWGGGAARREIATLMVHAEAPLAVRPFALDALDPDAQQRALDEIATREFAASFNYATPPLLRAALVRLGANDHVLMLVAHHLLCDGWSLGLLRHEIETIYDALAQDRPSPLAALEHRYGEFAAWERQRAQAGDFEAALIYWRDRWRDWHSALVDAKALATVRVISSHDDAVAPPETLTLDAALTRRIRLHARRAGLTLHTLCLTAFAAVLHGASGKDRIALWSPFANRKRREFEPLIGWFANLHLIGIDFSGEPAWEHVLRDVRATMLDAFAHQDLPLMLLLNRLMQRSAATGAAAFGPDPTHAHFDLTRERESRAGQITITRELLSPAPHELGLHLLAVERDHEIALRLRFPSFLRAGDMRQRLEELRDALDMMIASPRDRVYARSSV